MDSDGQVSLAGELDREAQEEYNITITVTDRWDSINNHCTSHSYHVTHCRGQPQRTAQTYMLVTVLDENDNAPFFSQVCYLWLHLILYQ